MPEGWGMMYGAFHFGLCNAVDESSRVFNHLMIGDVAPGSVDVPAAGLELFDQSLKAWGLQPSSSLASLHLHTFMQRILNCHALQFPTYLDQP